MTPPINRRSRVIVEISQFRLAEGVDEDAFLKAASETVTGFLETQPGYASRDLLRSDDGTWMDIVRFEGQEQASAAFAAFANHPSTREFERMLDVSTVQASHWSLVRAW
jgi:hypothetical protein